MSDQQLGNRWRTASRPLSLPKHLRCTGLISTSAHVHYSPLSPKLPGAHGLLETNGATNDFPCDNAIRRPGQLKSSRSVTWFRQDAARDVPAGAVSDDMANASTRLHPSAKLRGTARRWLAAYDNRLSQSFWSNHEGTRKPLRKDLCGPGPSSTTCRENYKKEKYGSQLDSICDDFDDGPPPRAGLVGEHVGQRRSRHASQAALLGELEDGIDQLDLFTANAKKRNHDNTRRRSHGSHHEPDSVAALPDEEDEFEAEELKKEERQARRRAARARDPRFRVELRLKSEQAARRQVGDTTMTKVQSLPMKRLEVSGRKGIEAVEVVDVKTLQSKCTGLANGCTVKTMLEAQRKKEQQCKLQVVARTSRARPSRSLPALSYEERLQMVQRRKLETYIGGQLTKMSMMRGSYPQDLPESVEHHLQMMQQDDYSWNEHDY